MDMSAATNAINPQVVAQQQAAAKQKADADKAIADAEKAKSQQAQDQFHQQQVSQQNMSNQYAAQAVKPVNDVTATQIAATPEARQQYMNALAMSQAAAQGQTPSVAQMQMQRGIDQAGMQALAVSRSGHGGFNPAALRAGLGSQSQLARQGIQDTSMLRAQEMAQGRSEYGNMSGNLLNADQSRAMAQAQLGQQTSLANQQAALANKQMLGGMSGQQQQGALSYGGMGLQMRGQDLGQIQSQAQLANQMQMAHMQADQADAASQRQLYGGILSGIAGLGGAAIMASDRNLKEDIRSGERDTSKFLNSLAAYSYRYKDPQSFGEGKKTSVMAQDLEKTDIGKQFVIDTPRGKMVDYGSALPTMLASLALMNKKLKKMETA